MIIFVKYFYRLYFSNSFETIVSVALGESMQSQKCTTLPIGKPDAYSVTSINLVFAVSYINKNI